MFLRSAVLTIVILFLSLPLPLFGSSAIASPYWPTESAVVTSSVMPTGVPQVRSSLSVVSQSGQTHPVWRQIQRWMPDSSHSAIASTSRPIASMSYPVKRAIPRILNSLVHTIVQCFRQFLWIATRQMQSLDYQWQTMEIIRPDANMWSVRSER